MSEVMNWPARFQEMVDLVEFTESDRQLIKDSRQIILSNVRKLTEDIYERLLAFPDAAQFFTTADGRRDEKRIEDNIQTMISWVRASVTAPSNQGFIRYLVGVSQMHANIPVHRPENTPVAPRFVIATVSYYQTCIDDLMYRHLEDPDLARRTCVAWNKWLIVMLELLLASYLKHDR